MAPGLVDDWMKLDAVIMHAASSKIALISVHPITRADVVAN